MIRGNDLILTDKASDVKTYSQIKPIVLSETMMLDNIAIFVAKKGLLAKTYPHEALKGLPEPFVFCGMIWPTRTG